MINHIDLVSEMQAPAIKCLKWLTEFKSEHYTKLRYEHKESIDAMEDAARRLNSIIAALLQGEEFEMSVEQLFSHEMGGPITLLYGRSSTIKELEAENTLFESIQKINSACIYLFWLKRDAMYRLMLSEIERRKSGQ
jgi:hypothetical protein